MFCSNAPSLVPFFLLYPLICLVQGHRNAEYLPTHCANVPEGRPEIILPWTIGLLLWYVRNGDVLCPVREAKALECRLLWWCRWVLSSVRVWFGVAVDTLNGSLHLLSFLSHFNFRYSNWTVSVLKVFYELDVKYHSVLWCCPCMEKVSDHLRSLCLMVSIVVVVCWFELILLVLLCSCCSSQDLCISWSCQQLPKSWPVFLSILMVSPVLSYLSGDKCLGDRRFDCNHHCTCPLCLLVALCFSFISSRPSVILFNFFPCFPSLRGGQNAHASSCIEQRAQKVRKVALMFLLLAWFLVVSQSCMCQLPVVYFRGIELPSLKGGLFTF